MRPRSGRPRTNHQRMRTRLLSYHASLSPQYAEHADAMAEFVMSTPRRRRVAAAATR